MLYAKRMVQLPTSRMQQFVTLSITTAVAFTLGVAIGPFGRAALSATASDQTSPAAVVAPAPAAMELYDGGWAGGPGPGAVLQSAPVERAAAPAVTELYDGGWAGGPGPGAVLRSEPAERAAAPAAMELYDGGWAGGPGPEYMASKASTISRVPYDAGWELYDGGWAGGPKTTSSN